MMALFALNWVGKPDPNALKKYFNHVILSGILQTLREGSIFHGDEMNENSDGLDEKAPEREVVDP